MGYTKPRPVNLYKRACSGCKCDLYLDKQDTYVVKKPKGLFKKYKETKFYCIPCDRDIKIKSLIRCLEKE